MTEQESIELNKFKRLAKNVEYYANPTLSSKEIVMFLANVLPETKCLSLPEIIKVDLSIYPVFTAIALWCDSSIGVGRQYPSEVIHISQKLFEVYGKKFLPVENN
jgi:hypothetical protein